MGDDSEAHGRHRWAHRVRGAGSGQISSAASRKKSGRTGAGTASGDGAEKDAGRAAGAGSVQRAASKASGVTRGPWSVAGVGVERSCGAAERSAQQGAEQANWDGAQQPCLAATAERSTPAAQRATPG